MTGKSAFPGKTLGTSNIGRAPVVDEQAVLEYFQEPVSGVPIRISASHPRAVSIELSTR